MQLTSELSDESSDLVCRHLIESWLLDVDVLCQTYVHVSENQPQRGLSQSSENTVLGLDSSHSDYKIGELVGWNLKCCTIQYTLLEMMTGLAGFRRPLPSDGDAETFGAQLASQPVTCTAIWAMSQQIISIIFMCLLASSVLAHTPEIHHLVLLCMTWYFLGSIQWIIFGVWQNPPIPVRVIFSTSNNLATINIVAIMLLRTFSSLLKSLDISWGRPRHDELSGLGTHMPARLLSLVIVWLAAISSLGVGGLLFLWRESRQL